MLPRQVTPCVLPLPDAAATPEEWAALRERRRAEITEQITVVLPRAVREAVLRAIEGKGGCTSFATPRMWGHIIEKHH